MVDAPVQLMLASRLADYAQRGITLTLMGLTLYGGYVLTVGGWGVIQRRKQRKVTYNTTMTPPIIVIFSQLADKANKGSEGSQ